MPIIAMLTACSTTPAPVTTPVSFTGTPYAFNVATINIIDDYKPSKQPPHAEMLSDITPSAAFRKWVEARLVARGQSGEMDVVIKDASIIQHTIPKKKTGLEGFFTDEQTEEYDGVLEAELKIYNEGGMLPVATIHVASKNSRTLNEDASIVDRQNLSREMGIELVHQIEPQLEFNIRQHFANYLVQ